MPRFSVWTIRLSLAYLAAGFTFGALLLAHKGVPLAPFLWSLLPAHIEFLLFGWTIQLVIGTAFWILPRFSRPPRRGEVRLAYVSVILLNLGVWLAGFGPLFSGSGLPVLVGRTAELASAALFALHAWPRVKPPGA